MTCAPPYNSSALKPLSSHIDPDRIALMGDGAGAHLAALVTLANAEPAFSSQYKNDPNASTPATVKAAAVFYGMYDLDGAMGA